MPIKDSAKTIVCYGDSNTWGRIPRGDRYPRSIRWTGVLQNLLGDDYEVINEGLNGRTLVASESDKPHKTGITHLKSILHTHSPVDLLIVMLGTNDVKDIYHLKAEDIAEHLDQTIKLVKENGVENIIVVCPPDFVAPSDGKVDPRFENTHEIIQKLPEMFRKVAEKYKCNFINTQGVIISSYVDGYHFDVEMHKKLAEILKAEIEKIFK